MQNRRETAQRFDLTTIRVADLPSVLLIVVGLALVVAAMSYRTVGDHAFHRMLRHSHRQLHRLRHNIAVAAFHDFDVARRVTSVGLLGGLLCRHFAVLIMFGALFMVTSEWPCSQRVPET